MPIVIDRKGSLRRIAPGSTLPQFKHEYSSDLYDLESPWVDVEKILKSGITKQQFAGYDDAGGRTLLYPDGSIICPVCQCDQFSVEEGLDSAYTKCDSCKKRWLCVYYSWATLLFDDVNIVLPSPSEEVVVKQKSRNRNITDDWEISRIE